MQLQTELTFGKCYFSNAERPGSAGEFRRVTRPEDEVCGSHLNFGANLLKDLWLAAGVNNPFAIPVSKYRVLIEFSCLRECE